MKPCKQCGLPVRWVKEQGRWKCRNPNGSDHWDACSQQRTKQALREGVPFRDRQGSGVRHRGKKKYMAMHAPERIGSKYTPSCGECAVPPWEQCACSERLAA